MSIQHYSVNSRPYSAFSILSKELNFEPDTNYLFDLSYLDVLSLEGEKSREFLQGQISCDVREVTKNEMRHGALCNLKGRVMALMDVIDWNGLHLVLPQDLLNDTKNSLDKTAVFSKVHLRNEQSFQLFGFYLQNPEGRLPLNLDLPKEPFKATSNNDCYCYHLDNNFYILLLKASDAESLTNPFVEHSQWRGSLAWHRLRLNYRQMEIYPETRGMFLPHRMDLHLLDYLNFNKGCYKGQEIIARTHYRATLKHQLKLFSVQTDVLLHSGTRLFAQESLKEVGELIDFTPLTFSTYLIAVSILLDHPEVVKLETTDAPLIPISKVSL